ncbi:MAG: VOC family protein [Isosphaeraceae bacterium]
MKLPSLVGDSQRIHHRRLQHVAFKYPTVEDLLATYARLKGLGIEPVLTADHGATTGFYYEDPDRNSIELLADDFGDSKKSTECLRTSSEFAANPMGAYVDPDAMVVGDAGDAVGLPHLLEELRAVPFAVEQDHEACTIAVGLELGLSRLAGDILEQTRHNVTL